jgi:hypothetical protein
MSNILDAATTTTTTIANTSTTNNYNSRSISHGCSSNSIYYSSGSVCSILNVVHIMFLLLFLIQILCVIRCEIYFLYCIIIIIVAKICLAGVHLSS